MFAFGLFRAPHSVLGLAVPLLVTFLPLTLFSASPSRHNPAGTNESKVSTLDAFLDLVRNMFPENLMQACFNQVETNYRDVKVKASGSKWVQNVTMKKERVVVYKEGTNILGLIVFCTAFGILCGQMGEEAEPMVRFFVVLNDIVMKIVIIVMWYSPFGIMSLIIGKILSIDDMAQTASQLGMYMVTVIIGLVLHASITLPLIFFACTKKNPFTFFRGLFVSFLTSGTDGVARITSHKRIRFR